MEIYSDSLAHAFNEFQSDKISVSQFRPSSTLERYSGSRFAMRYLRYWQYPYSVRREVSESKSIDIHHVLDHGYAHLHPKLSRAKTCSSVHDLIPMLQWLGMVGPSPSRKPWLNLKSLSYLPAYDKLVAISDNTKQDMVEYLHIPSEKIAVIPPVVAEHFKPISSTQTKQFAQRYGLSTECQWIMISGREYYKNHESCLAVLKQLIEETSLNVRLIKTGLPSIEFDQLVGKLGLENSVTQLFLADFSELPLLYNFIDCLLFPSLYEGFGMPVAEALACGTPVVCSNRGPLPEVGGALALYNDPFDVDGLCQSVLEVLSDNAVKEKIVQFGSQWCEQFRGSAVADQFQKLYSSMLN
jgi:glycosyltransferase involved in cell wall biosynthesis